MWGYKSAHDQTASHRLKLLNRDKRNAVMALLADEEWSRKGSEAVCRRQALISWVTRRTRRRERIEMKAISMKATRCPRSKMVFNRR
jgi:hypothetical protein